MQIAVDHSVRRSTQNGVVSCSRRISGFRQANTASRGDRQSHTHFSDGDTSIPYGLQRRWILQSNVALPLIPVTQVGEVVTQSSTTTQLESPPVPGPDSPFSTGGSLPDASALRAVV